MPLADPTLSRLAADLAGILVLDIEQRTSLAALFDSFETIDDAPDWVRSAQQIVDAGGDRSQLAPVVPDEYGVDKIAERRAEQDAEREAMERRAAEVFGFESVTAAADDDTMVDTEGANMPYEIVNDHPDCEAETPYAVVAVDEAEVMGCHRTEADAEQQVAALMLAESTEAVLASLAPEDRERWSVVAASVMDRPEEWHAVAAIEGKETVDGRVWSEGALTWQDLPVPLMWQYEEPEGDNGHARSVLVGATTRIEKIDGVLHMYGVFDDSDRSDEAQRLIGSGMMTGVSIDGGDISPGDVEVIVEEDETGEPVTVTEIYRKTRIMGLTVLAFPALPEAFIEIIGEPIVEAEPAVEIEVEDEAEDEQIVAAAAETVDPLDEIISDPGSDLSGDDDEDEDDDVVTIETGAGAATITVRLDPSRARATNRGGEVMLSLPLLVESVTAAVEPAAQTLVKANVAEPISGAMLALIPSEADAARLAVAGAEAPDQLHVTLTFLGDDAETISGEARAALHEWAAGWAAAAQPLTLDAWAAANFNPVDNPCAVYLIGDRSGAGLEAAHDDALSATAAAIDDVPDQHSPWVPHLTIGYGLDPAMLTEFGPVTFDRVRVAFADDVTDHPLGGEAVDADEIIVASIAAPDEPPAAWFADPQLDRPTPLTVTDDGRLFGHIYRRGQCHVAFQDRCVKVPVDDVDYDGSFHLGEVVTAGGGRVQCGQITVDAGHAKQYDRRGRPILAFQARQHYDHTGWVGADIRAGADAHGIWVAGAVRPGLTARQVRAMMGAKPSGDWRKGDPRVDTDIRMARRGPLALVAVASVTSPGYPQTRAGFHDGEAFGLVASASWGDEQPEDDGVRRIRMPAGVDLAAVRIAATIGRTPRQRAAELAAKILGG